MSITTNQSSHHTNKDAAGARIQFDTAFLKRARVFALLVLLGFVTYWGVPFLGLGMDDYSMLEDFSHLETIRHIVTLSSINRLPVHFAIYAALLQLPVSIAATLKILVHVANAGLLMTILRRLDFSKGASLAAALLFVVWPSNIETLFWLIAGYNIFSVFFILSAIALLLDHKLVSSGALLIAGMLCSEAVVIPAVFFCWLILFLQHHPFKKQVVYIGGLGAIFVFYYVVVRHIISSTGNIARYAIGTSLIFSNVKSWLEMLAGLGTSTDTAWMWNRSVTVGLNMLLLPMIFALIALVVALLIALLAYRIQNRLGSYQSQPSASFVLRIGILLGGLLLAVAPFAVISGNGIQSRNTYVGSIFLCTLFGLVVGRGWNTRDRIPRWAATLLLTGLIGWGVYLNWSGLFMNFYPAHVVSNLLIRDIRQTYTDTHADNIFIVNEPKVVGVGMALSRDWAYIAVGHMWVQKSVHVSADQVPGELASGSLEIGEPIVEPGQTCVFLGWQDGKRMVTMQARWGADGPILNCMTNRVQSSPADSPLLVYNPGATSVQYLDDFCINRCILPAPIYETIVAAR